MKKLWILILLLPSLPLLAQDKGIEAFLGMHYNAMEQPTSSGDAVASAVLNIRAQLAVSYEYPVFDMLELGGEFSLSMFPYFEDNDGDEEFDLILADFELRGKGSLVLPGNIEVEALGGWFFYNPDALGYGYFVAWDIGARIRLGSAYFEGSAIIPMTEVTHPFDSTLTVKPYARLGAGFTL